MSCEENCRHVAEPVKWEATLAMQPMIGGVGLLKAMVVHMILS